MLYLSAGNLCDLLCQKYPHFDSKKGKETEFSLPPHINFAVLTSFFRITLAIPHVLLYNEPRRHNHAAEHSGVPARHAPMLGDAPLNTIVLDYTVLLIVLCCYPFFKREQQKMGFGVSL